MRTYLRDTLRAFRATGPGPLLRLAGLIALVGVVAWLARDLELPDAVAVQAWSAALGPLAPAAFAVGYALIVPTPLPKSVLTTLAGLVFGIPLGVAVAITGATAGAAIAFLAARRLGRDAVTTLTRGGVARVDGLVDRYGVRAALTVRLVPLMPFTMLNYACGVTTMRLRHFIVGTALGILPGTLVWATVGSVGGEISPWVPVIASVVLGCVTLVIGAVRLSLLRASAPATAPEVASPHLSDDVQ